MKQKFNIKFRLEHRKDKETGEKITSNVPIIFDFTFDGKRLKSSTGYRIDADKWDVANEKVYKNNKNENKITAADINERLDDIKVTLREIYKEAKALKINPTVPYMTEELRKRLNDPERKRKDFFEIFEYFLTTEAPKNSWTNGTISKFHSIINHLLAFQEQKHYHIEFENMNEAFFNRFVEFLRKEKMHRNTTIFKNLKILRWFLNWATKHGYNRNLSFKEFNPDLKGVSSFRQIIFLTPIELMKLYQLDIKSKFIDHLKDKLLNLNKTDEKYLKKKQVIENLLTPNIVEIKSTSLEQVRDVFCFCCFTGLRYSDIYNLKRSEVKAEHIEIITIKTDDILYINLNDFAKEILDKYAKQVYHNNKCLPVISNQKMNDHLKELGRLAEINEPQTMVYFVGSERIESTYAKWQLLTTHVARKTFVTNAFFLGIPSEVIMKWTGHSSAETMKPYQKIVDEQKQKEMNKFNLLKQNIKA